MTRPTGDIDTTVPDSPSDKLPVAHPTAHGRANQKIVANYHERTKHHYDRFAAARGYLDWATQPDPFRRYEGASLTRLPLPPEGRVLPYWQLYEPAGVKAASLSADSVSLFFRYALSVTAWKRLHTATWSLRANPSSGNLHPTEGYALLPALTSLHDHPGVYHYAPKEHGLERRADLDLSAWIALTEKISPDAFFVGLTSIPWREAWKYGERAFRYCQHDVGHALGSLRFAAAALGWTVRVADQVGDAAVAELLGLNRAADYGGAERELPELLALVAPHDSIESAGLKVTEQALQQLSAAQWHGTANALSGEHGVDWPVIDEVALVTTHAATAINEDFSGFPSKTGLFEPPIRSGSGTAEKVILGRRSAVHLDASTALPADTFFRMLSRLVPTRDRRSVPWDAIPWRPRIHLGLFVHRVNDVAPGLYALARDPRKVDTLRLIMKQDFHWLRPPSCPRSLPLYLLEEGDCRRLAASVSCGQNIAGDGAFSLAMIADYWDSLVTHGPAFYRSLFWEAGLVGQVLYLEAEESGIRSTGIGCYFDDPVHEVFGISSRDWQDLYHFTVGGPIEDRRLTTLPAYGSAE